MKNKENNRVYRWFTGRRANLSGESWQGKHHRGSFFKCSEVKKQRVIVVSGNFFYRIWSDKEQLRYYSDKKTAPIQDGTIKKSYISKYIMNRCN